MPFNQTLEEIEFKRQELERHLANVVGRELAQWQRDNGLCVLDVGVRLANVSCIGGPKQNIVTSVSVELDYKP
ncbi:hypothetical protein [Acinetobacter larvae]|uniref:Uncharacterized protein n=1 Tax=Acinetobacter larvae TaxID=1789224 RepID=A0A1B2LZ57_9GAMM|nr:hypothetical protein [Acinetobacter larvae]AOA58217.1 hypothetical protein BFG52_07540 [Acinetobacter larvae]